MIYLLYSETNASTLRMNLGAAEYSYFFVLEYFRLMLEQYRERYVLIGDPEQEADVHYDAAVLSGEQCVLLSFAPPHRTFLNLRCPTIPVFAWEFDTLPNEVWDNDARNDWRSVLTELGHAITHSQYSADAIKRAMGEHFPVLAIPAPVFDRCNGEQDERPRELIASGPALDSQSEREIQSAAPIATTAHATTDQVTKKSIRQRLRLTLAYFAQWYRDVIRDLLPAPVQRLGSHVARGVFASLKAVTSGGRSDRETSARRHGMMGEGTVSPTEGERPDPASDDSKAFRLPTDGVIYTSVFNPFDGRKNWEDILKAFCCSLSDQEDAVLILKFTNARSTAAMDIVRDTLRRLPPFRCRVLVLGGLLDESEYRTLIAASTYVVNSSLSEGQCLPLMEFLSYGKPAIAPRNTAMTDYFDERIGFVVNSSKELCCWPHDPRNVFRAHRYRTDWQSLVDAFSASYRLKRGNPQRYDEMARAAITRMQDYCSQSVVWERFQSFVRVRSPAQPCRSPRTLETDSPAAAQLASPVLASPS